MKMEFKNKVAIVTGGAQGMGLAYCTKLLKEGMKVCMCDVKENSPGFQTLSTTYKDDIVFQKCDVSSFNDFKAAFDRTLEAFGRIDLLVNNAGMMDEKNWTRCIQVNYIGTANGMKLGLEYMGKDKGGSGGNIVNIGSMAVYDAFELAPIYNSTKHAVVGLTKNYGRDYYYKKTGIKVFCVCPGAVDTSMFHTVENVCLDPDEVRRLLANVKLIKPEAIADGLIKILRDGKNGSILRVQTEFIKYVEDNDEETIFGK